jgi:hypothetical protein
VCECLLTFFLSLFSLAIPSSPPCRSRTRLFELENELLEHLSAPSADILSDSALIESLERTKEVKDKLEESLIAIGETEDKIDEQREAYRSVAVHGATLFFALTQLGNIDPMYTYSLDSYLHYFDKALASAVVERLQAYGTLGAVRRACTYVSKVAQQKRSARGQANLQNKIE